MKRKKIFKITGITILVIIVLFFIGIWVAVRIYDYKEEKSFYCDDPTYFTCQGATKGKKVKCNTDDDCTGVKPQEFCQPGDYHLLNCPARYFCGEEGYCQVCCPDCGR